MYLKRTGIAVLLAGILATCLPFDVSAKPRASRPDPANTAQQMEVQALQARVRELGETQARLLKQVEEQALLLEQVKQAAALQSVAEPAQPFQEEIEEDSRLDWVLAGIAAFACALCVVLLFRVRQPEAALRLDKDAGADVPGLEPEAAVPPPVHPMLPALPDWDPASPALDLRAAEVFASEEKTQAHDSTIELAEIMLSFGRVNSAAEALANFIENNPKAAIAPWLKLLEVYRESGQRAEFDKIALKLNKTFNVRTVDWDNFAEFRDPAHGLEEIPHIMMRLQQLWGTRECQAYLQYLLRDNRDETRLGFMLTAVDDILCLNAILEYDLGPYTGPLETSPTSDGTEENAPLTETDKKSLQAADEMESASDEDEDGGEQSEPASELASEPALESMSEPASDWELVVPERAPAAKPESDLDWELVSESEPEQGLEPLQKGDDGEPEVEVLPGKD
ncbi:MAG: hypothetical protein LBP58_06190 [Azoarcus sp.]|jgi:hypothetical protein|nr:hypothetical protein [Azoarcus sp.]